MSTAELKNLLIEKIQKTNDELLLEEAYRLFESEDLDTDHFFLNDRQVNLLNESREEIKDGRSLTEDAANKEIEEWLKK